MKANELQIGDWVVKPSGHICTMGRAEFSNDDAWFEDTKPIPLTAEILEKNGWMHDKELKHWWHAGVEFVIWYDLKTFQDFYCCEITSMKFNYVHELQNALRLCGLGEMADSFKV